MLSKIIQNKIPPGTRVKFLLKTGKEICGIFRGATEEYALIQDKPDTTEPTVILLEFIGAWEMLDEQPTDDFEVMGLTEDTVIERAEISWEDIREEESSHDTPPVELEDVPRQEHHPLVYVGLSMGIVAFVLALLFIVAKFMELFG